MNIFYTKTSMWEYDFFKNDIFKQDLYHIKINLILFDENTKIYNNNEYINWTNAIISNKNKYLNGRFEHGIYSNQMIIAYFLYKNNINFYKVKSYIKCHLVKS